MDHLATISGAMSVLSVRLEEMEMYVRVNIPVLLNLRPLLAATTTVNQEILTKNGKIRHIQMTSYGMESSVVMKAHAALVPTLHHGSV